MIKKKIKENLYLEFDETLNEAEVLSLESIYQHSTNDGRVYVGVELVLGDSVEIESLGSFVFKTNINFGVELYENRDERPFIYDVNIKNADDILDLENYKDLLSEQLHENYDINVIKE